MTVSVSVYKRALHCLVCPSFSPLIRIIIRHCQMGFMYVKLTVVCARVCTCSSTELQLTRQELGKASHCYSLFDFGDTFSFVEVSFAAAPAPANGRSFSLCTLWFVQQVTVLRSEEANAGRSNHDATLSLLPHFAVTLSLSCAIELYSHEQRT